MRTPASTEYVLSTAYPVVRSISRSTGRLETYTELEGYQDTKRACLSSCSRRSPTCRSFLESLNGNRPHGVLRAAAVDPRSICSDISWRWIRSSGRWDIVAKTTAGRVIFGLFAGGDSALVRCRYRPGAATDCAGSALSAAMMHTGNCMYLAAW